MPGALRPTACPRNAVTHGSLWVIQPSTPWSSSPIFAAYSAKRSAVSRTAQPPTSCRACGQVPVIQRRDRLDPAFQQIRRRAAGTSRARADSTRRARRAAPAATRSRTGRTPARARPSGPDRKPTGGSDRTPRPRCRRSRRPPACARSDPRSTRRARPRARRPRPGRPPSRSRTESRRGTLRPKRATAVGAVAVIPSPPLR